MGNKLGWIMSGVFIALILGFIFVVYLSPYLFSSYDSENFGPGDMHKIEIRTGIEKVIGHVPSGAGDAASDYHEAVEIFMQNEDHLNDLLGAFDMGESNRLSSGDLSTCEGMRRHVRAGAKKKEMKYTLEYSPGRFQPIPEGARGLGCVGTVLLSLLFRHNYAVKDFDNCLEIAGEVMVLGWHMVNERSRGHMLMLGAQLQADAARFMRTVYHERSNDPKINITIDYENDADRLYADCQEKMKFIRNPNPVPGDIFYLIKNHEDRTWKVEGLFTLLYLRYRKRNSRGCRITCDRLLDRYAGSDDPYLQAAVRSVRENDLWGDDLVVWWRRGGDKKTQ